MMNNLTTCVVGLLCFEISNHASRTLNSIEGVFDLCVDAVKKAGLKQRRLLNISQGWQR
jgi:hypothetical protein